MKEFVKGIVEVVLSLLTAQNEDEELAELLRLQRKVHDEIARRKFGADG